MSVTIEVFGLDELLERLEVMKRSLVESPRQFIQEAADIAKEAMRHEAPERTGALRRGIRYRTFEDGHQAWARFFVDSPADAYAMFVIHGTAAHVIRPSTAKALFWPGADHPVAFVQHPGTKPDDFVGRAMDELERASNEVLDQIGEAIVQGERFEA